MTKFISDSSCDMFSQKDNYFETVPLTIYTDEVSYTDDETMDVHEMLGTLEKYKGRSYTACPGPEDWLKAFSGADTIYVVTMTSALSGTYNSAEVAKGIYLQKNPDARVEIIDTLSTGPEQRLIIEKLMELHIAGIGFKEVCKKIRRYIEKTRLFFSFMSLHNFAQNGRVSKVIASTVGMLGISIIGTASAEGTIKPITKCRGEKKTVATLMNALTGANYNGGKVRICHIENEKLAGEVTAAIKEKFPLADVLAYPARGLCSYYGERYGIIIGCETGVN